jgi:hypothetical protein
MISDPELAELEGSVTAALARGEAGDLAVLGRGEISVVLGWPSDAPAWACKRLPPFADAAAADRYATTLQRYLAELAGRGVSVVDTDVRRVAAADGREVLYCVQPALPEATLAVRVARDDREQGTAVIAAIVDAAVAVVDPAVGLDAQLSNWAMADGQLAYLDITTPMLRSPDGSSELDTDLFLASLPWAMRAPVRRFVLPGILERYHDPRTVVLDLAANLVKERLDHLVPAVLDASAGRLEPPLTQDEVRRDYRSDARMWALLQAVRRADRWWQRRVRRRTYPFLLPEGIER